MIKNHILAGIVALAAVIGGVFVGFYFYKHNQSTASVALSSAPSPVIPAAPNTNIYDISPPSRGAFSKTLPVDLTDIQNNLAKASLDNAKSGDIKVGQHVILYRADGMFLEIIGTVASIEKNFVTIAIAADREHPASQVARGEIVLGSQKSAQRLPLSSIVQDQQGKDVLWEVLNNQDGTQTAKQRQANIVARTYDFIVIDPEEYVSNVYVLNPDDALADGQKIQTRTMLYAAPAETAEMRVLKAIDDRRPRNAADPYKGPIPESRCALAAAANTGTAGTAQSSCGQSTDALSDFIQKIRQNTNNTPESP